MNIVKQLNDPEFFERHFFMELDDDDLSKGYWIWGLGDDGELYFRCSLFTHGDMWHPYPEEGYSDKLLVTFGEMRKIVKEFGHLVVFT